MAVAATVPAHYGCSGADAEPRDERVAKTGQAYTYPQPTAALLIITSDFLAPSFQTLANHKNATGMSAQVLTMDQVRSMSQGADDPERIKRTIATYVQSYGTRYVLLGGDPMQVPTRHRAVVGSDHTTVLSFNFTDHYYSNLYKGHNPDGSNSGVFDTWDGDGDGLFNKEYWDAENADTANPDNVDGYPDVAVGRVPFSTTSEIDTYVSKVIAYESSGWWAQASSAYPATFVADDQYSGSEGDAQQIESNLTWSTQNAADLHVEVEASSPPYGGLWLPAGASGIKWAASATPLMFYVGHGGPFQWGYNGVLFNTDVNGFSNTNQYPVVFAAGCETAQFAPMDEIPNLVSPPDDWAAQANSIGATWLSPYSQGGGIAYIGESLVMPDLPGVNLATSFGKHVSAGVKVLGDAWHLAQLEYWRNPTGHDDLGAARIFLSIENLLGDPSLRLQVVHRNRTAIPKADWDGDGISDVGVFRNGSWFVINSSGLNGPGGFAGQTRTTYGQSGDIPVTGDYDGDGRSDQAVFRPSNGVWYIENSSGVTGWSGNAGQTVVQYGAAGDIPMSGDYDGDGVADPALFRPSSATWFILNSSNTTGAGGVSGQTRLQYGATGDIPVSGDFDGDGLTDIALFRPSNNTWYIVNSSGTTGAGGFSGQTRIAFGANGDVPLSGDYDGDGTSDIAVFRPSNGYWYITNSSGATGDGGFQGQTRVQWGESGDVPVSGDFDGDGFADFAVFRPGVGTWYIMNSRGIATPAPAMNAAVQYGQQGDDPLSGDPQ
jgi:hypothetical protein